MNIPDLPTPNWQPTAVRLRLDKKQPCTLRQWQAPIEFDLAGVRWVLVLSWFDGEDFDPQASAERFVRTHLTRALEGHGFIQVPPVEESSQQPPKPELRYKCRACLQHWLPEQCQCLPNESGFEWDWHCSDPFCTGLCDPSIPVLGGTTESTPSLFPEAP